MTAIARALVVGVARYKSVVSLPDAVRNDVADIAALLRNPAVSALEHDAVTLMVDEAVTADAIRTAFRDIATTMPPDGIFLFYFSGHGERGDAGGREQSWLLPHDTDLANLAATAISSDEIVTLLNAIGARRQVLMIDACHAGGLGSAKSPEVEPKGFGKSGVDALSQGAGRVLLTSSRADETSGIIRGARNSIFTTSLIEALLGAAIDRGDGAIGVLDVFDYVSTEVPKRADQHPVFHAGDLDSNFAIARRPPGAAAAVIDTNSLTEIFARLYPAGPNQDGIWARAGGDVSRLILDGTGTGQWHSALSKLRLGGGGLTLRELLRTAHNDYPESEDLDALISLKTRT
jgi:hypothetical protein